MGQSQFDEAKALFGKPRAGDLAAMAAERGGMVNPILPEFLKRMDPQFVEIYNKYQAPRLRADQVSIEEYRSNPTKYTLSIAPGPKPEVGSVKIYNVSVDQPPGEIKVAVYRPTEEAIVQAGLNPGSTLPAHVNYHGGGWVIGGLNSDESWCRQACQALPMVIVDVDYRLAPEYPFPTQIWDSWVAVKWVFANARELSVDPSSVSIGGLSAGGHLAAVLALLARDEEGMPPLKLQLLVVPAVDARYIPIEGSCDPKAVPYETYITCEHAPCLPLERMRWFHNLWLGKEPEQRKESNTSWIASPILANSLAGLAPARILCAEFDVLRSEAEIYNEKLCEAGSESSIKIFKGVAHPWGHWDGELEKAKEYVADTFSALKHAHGLNH